MSKKTERHVVIDEEVMKKLKLIAQKQNRTMKAVVTMLIEKELGK